MEKIGKPVFTFSRTIILLITVFVNGFLIFCLIVLILGLIAPRTQIYVGVLLTIAVIAILIGSSFTPIGEKIFIFTYGLREPNVEEKAILDEPWRKVLETSRIQDTGINPRLLIQNDKFPNAFAFSTRTVTVTKGLLNCPPEEIEGVIAHELGHIIHGDSQIALLVSVINTVGNYAAKVLSFVIFVFSRLTEVIGDIGGGYLGAVVSLAGFFMGLIALILKGLLWVVQKLINIGFLAVGRQEEFNADSYAKEIGFGDGLVSLLKKLENIEAKPTGFWNAVESSHPPIDMRINKLLYG